jgi:hypothetical protein
MIRAALRIAADPRFFPTVLIVLDLAAAARYAAAGDARRLIYWIAAAVLTTTVTY